ncbi:ADP-ribosylglycohydrolase family protein [Streptomyces sp. NBC_01351]|uniref:ADP-ribosylglycohydrolase family protein n=1 Tax=Streptomyces sp. NBC_01351 TaxID=2903833 RepID=UPI002E323EE6|nr:ADP-ribosylglycohydrolase family protein [Streptomyces sp. NBC_01351]
MNDRGVDVARHSLEGLVLGDAFGQSWFVRDAAAGERWLAGRVLRSGPWKWTDDAAMALVLYGHLTRHGEVRPGELAGDFAAEYARDPYRQYGASMHEVLERIGAGEDWRTVTGEQFGGQGSWGNGAAMRVAPLGAWFHRDLGAVVEQARLSALATHAHPQAVAGAVAVAVAAALAAAGRGGAAPQRPGFLREVADLVPEGEVRDLVLVAAELPAGTTVREAAERLGSGWRISAPDTVPFALWCAAGQPDDLPEALWRTLEGWGDRDTTCAIVGGVVAARTGLAAVPAEWRASAEPLPLRAPGRRG